MSALRELKKYYKIRIGLSPIKNPGSKPSKYHKTEGISGEKKIWESSKLGTKVNGQ